MTFPNEWLGRIGELRLSWNETLGRLEQSGTRVITLEESYKKLGVLSLKQDDLLRQAFRCTENELYRAAHLMAWAAFIDFLHNKLAEDNFQKLAFAMTSWRLNVVEDLREQSDFQVIEAAKKINFLRRSEQKALHGLLNKRNECAHPEDYYPKLNDTLGFVTEILTRIEGFMDRKL